MSNAVRSVGSELRCKLETVVKRCRMGADIKHSQRGGKKRKQTNIEMLQKAMDIYMKEKVTVRRYVCKACFCCYRLHVLQHQQ